jgi:hypothetical protein
MMAVTSFIARQPFPVHRRARSPRRVAGPAVRANQDSCHPRRSARQLNPRVSQRAWHSWALDRLPISTARAAHKVGDSLAAGAGRRSAPLPDPAPRRSGRARVNSPCAWRNGLRIVKWSCAELPGPCRALSSSNREASRSDRCYGSALARTPLEIASLAETQG